MERGSANCAELQPSPFHGPVQVPLPSLRGHPSASGKCSCVNDHVDDSLVSPSVTPHENYYILYAETELIGSSVTPRTGNVVALLATASVTCCQSYKLRPFGSIIDRFTIGKPLSCRYPSNSTRYTRLLHDGYFRICWGEKRKINHFAPLNGTLRAGDQETQHGYR